MTGYVPETLIRELPLGSNILDIGCLAFRMVKLASSLGRMDVAHSGIDYMDLSASAPVGFTFRRADLSREPLPFPDDAFDLVVASHVIEHLRNPIEFAIECVRVAKPGGLIYVEAPSERSLWLPSMPFEHEKFFSLNFFDDPTHQFRPWPPQALYRLFRYLSCEVVSADYYYSKRIRILLPWYLFKAWRKKSGCLLEQYLWLAVGWSAFAVVRKPGNLQGTPVFNYYIPESR